MKFVKRPLSIFLVCCTLPGQVPARAAEASGEVPKADSSLLVIVSGDGESSDDAENQEEPEGSETSDPSPGDISHTAEKPGNQRSRERKSQRNIRSPMGMMNPYHL